MDFHSLTRKELQILCKKNKIPANLTNVAMADALAALTQVEGSEELGNVLQSVPQTPQPSSLVKQPVVSTEENEPNSPITVTRTRRGVRKMNKEDEEKAQQPPPTKDKPCGLEMLKTPAPRTTRRRAAATSVSVSQKVESGDNDVQGKEGKDKEKSVATRAYTTRRSARLVSETKPSESGLQKKVGVRRTESIKIAALTEEESDEDTTKASDAEIEESINEIQVADKVPPVAAVVLVGTKEEPALDNSTTTAETNGNLEILSFGDSKDILENPILEDGLLQQVEEELIENVVSRDILNAAAHVHLIPVGEICDDPVFISKDDDALIANTNTVDHAPTNTLDDATNHDAPMLDAVDLVVIPEDHAPNVNAAYQVPVPGEVSVDVVSCEVPKCPNLEHKLENAQDMMGLSSGAEGELFESIQAAADISEIDMEELRNEDSDQSLNKSASQATETLSLAGEVSADMHQHPHQMGNEKLCPEIELDASEGASGAEGELFESIQAAADISEIDMEELRNEDSDQSLNKLESQATETLSLAGEVSADMHQMGNEKLCPEIELDASEGASLTDDSNLNQVPTHLLNLSKETPKSSMKKKKATPIPKKMFLDVLEDDKEEESNKSGAGMSAAAAATTPISKMAPVVIADNKENNNDSGGMSLRRQIVLAEEKEKKNESSSSSSAAAEKALKNKSLRQLKKIFKQKLVTDKSRLVNNKEEMQLETRIRPALQALTDNYLMENREN